jgi:methylthioribose-1-phosphate isomerase
VDPFSPVAFARPILRVLDQTRLPHEEVWLELGSVEAVCEAVAVLRVRGAPLLGVVGAAGMAVAAEEQGTSDQVLSAAARRIGETRPTAVELSSGADGALRAALAVPAERRLDALWEHARHYLERRVAEDLALGEHGAGLLGPGTSVLTHCNTGALATGGIGTALGVVRAAWRQGKLTRCYATETRPLLQGARLTAWELRRAGIPATLLPDTAAAGLIASGDVEAVVTGADRIAANGDTANKVGTYGLAAVAARHGVPFYIAAPRSTFDRQCPSGESIPIEFRRAEEVGGYGGQRWAPAGMEAYNPAFDVTPAELVTAFITERGVIAPPFAAAIAAALDAP